MGEYRRVAGIPGDISDPATTSSFAWSRLYRTKAMHHALSSHSNRSGTPTADPLHRPSAGLPQTLGKIELLTQGKELSPAPKAAINDAKY